MKIQGKKIERKIKNRIEVDKLFLFAILSLNYLF